jgi:hypothetical protein
MQEEEHFVQSMKDNLETNAVFVTVEKSKFKILKHLNSTSPSGENINLIIAGQLWIVSGKCSEDLMKQMLGSLVSAE